MKACLYVFIYYKYLLFFNFNLDPFLRSDRERKGNKIDL